MYPPRDQKNAIRELHSFQRAEKANANANFVSSNLAEFESKLANGIEINPKHIDLTLVPVASGTLEARLFRMASLTWSVPVSSGFGRRMRYLVWDSYHGKLAGILALGDPVFNLKVRDLLIGWNSRERAERLCNILDAYVLGAIPPYNMLLCGKAIACLVSTREVYRDFKDKYGSSVGVISGERKSPKLLAVTTSSSMGRSSVYNRLELGGKKFLMPIGYTTGWGHFHVPECLFEELREYLARQNHPYADENNYGQGPNWRLRTIKAAFALLGLQTNLLHHGVKRQVFFAPLAKNAVDILRHGGSEPDLTNMLSVNEVSELARERWMVPRANRQELYKSWVRSDVESLLYSSHIQRNRQKALI